MKPPLSKISPNTTKELNNKSRLMLKKINAITTFKDVIENFKP